MSDRRFILNLYKHFLQLANEVGTPSVGERIYVRRPLDPRLYAQGIKAVLPKEWRRKYLSSILPGTAAIPPMGIFTRDSLRKCIRESFLQPQEDPGKALDTALRGLRTLQQQLTLQRNSSITETNGIMVEATSSPLPEDTAAPFAGPEGGPTTFYMYRMRIENRSPNTVQLTGRHLQFFSRGRLFLEVPRHSPGVVGHTPILQPGESFEYISGTAIPLDSHLRDRQPPRTSGALVDDLKREYATGSMIGSFQMVQCAPGGRKVEGSDFDTFFGPLRLSKS